MLNHLVITQSRLRRKLLAYFFTNPEMRVYVREAAAILREDAGNVSKELGRLEKEGILVSAMRGNQKHLSLNKQYPLYRELNSIIFKTLGVEGSLRSIVNDTENIVFSCIYGSFARHKETGSSDIDLLIVGSPDEDAIMPKIDALEKKLGREINYTIYPAGEFKQKLKKNDSFINNVLKGPKIILRGKIDGIRRFA